MGDDVFGEVRSATEGGRWSEAVLLAGDDFRLLDYVDAKYVDAGNESLLREEFRRPRVSPGVVSSLIGKLSERLRVTSSDDVPECLGWEDIDLGEIVSHLMHLDLRKSIIASISLQVDREAIAKMQAMVSGQDDSE